MRTDIGVEKIHWAFATKRHHWLSQPLAGLVFATKHLAGREEHPRNTQTFLGLIGRKNPRLALAEGLGIDVELAGQSFLAKAECSGNLVECFRGDAFSDPFHLLQGWHGSHRCQTGGNGLRTRRGCPCHEGKVGGSFTDGKRYFYGIAV